MDVSAPSGSNTANLLLIAGPDQLPAAVATALSDNFQVTTVPNGQQALAVLAQTAVDIIVAVSPLADGAEADFCRHLQNLTTGHYGACVLLVSQSTGPAIVHMFHSGADDCLPLSMDPKEMVARLQALVRCCQRHRQLNPLTGLPGNAHLSREITRRLPDRGHLAVIAFDLQDFKAYNDLYGYYRGDQVITQLSQILLQATNEHGASDDWIAHIGGDDFFVLTSPEKMQALADAAINEFEQMLPKFYDHKDRQRGGIIGFTRQGEEGFFPFMRLFAAAVTNEPDDIQHVGQIAAILSELKEYAKQPGNRGLVVDRRQTHDARHAWRQRPGFRT